MTDNFHSKYRIASARWPTWDYGTNAAYFITICTASRIPFFGEIFDEELSPNQLGQEAARCWSMIPLHFPFVVLDAFTLMPNHLHGILAIEKSDDNDGKRTTGAVA